MIRTIETPVSWITPISRPAHVGRCVAGYPPVQCVVSCVEAISFALIRQRVLSIIALCSIVWLASIWLAAADAQAQESPSNEASLSATEPAFVQRSLERTQGPHLLLTMVAHSDRELGALRTSAIQSIGPNPTPRNAGEARLPSNPRGAEFASLAALASAPPSSLLYSIKTKGPGQADISSVSNDNSALVYRVGTINFVINRLPNNFSVSSVSSLGNSLSDARR
jgi:hypothetical protein